MDLLIDAQRGLERRGNCPPRLKYLLFPGALAPTIDRKSFSTIRPLSFDQMRITIQLINYREPWSSISKMMILVYLRNVQRCWDCCCVPACEKWYDTSHEMSSMLFR